MASEHVQALRAPGVRSLSVDAWHYARPAAFDRPSTVIAFDFCERVIIGCLFGSFAYRIASHFAITADLSTLLIIVSEALPIAFIIGRRPSATLSRQPTDWLVGIAATIAPLMITPNATGSIAPQTVWFTIMIAGMYIQIAAKVILGRSFGIIAANRGVRTLGPYRFVRHPMYAGYTLTHAGFLLTMPSLLNLAVYSLALALQIARILREERVLTQDAAYRQYAARVRYRLLPGVF